MRWIFLPAAAGALGVALWAQAPRPPEPLTSWQFFKELQTPVVTPNGLLDFVLDPEMLDHCRPDYADLRLYRDNVEAPYVLRVRREIDTTESFTAREFNRGASEGVAQVSFDLGEQPQVHNEVDIDTAGNNFRRLAEVEGSADGANWSTLFTGTILFRFSAGGRTAEQRAVFYPVSRYRYLRVRVARDPQVDRAAPEISGVQIRRSVHRKGEMLSFPVTLLGRDPDRAGNRSVSAWRMNLNARVPFERLVLSINDALFSRPFVLESIDDPASPVVIASGELTRRDGAGTQTTTIDFAESRARLLKLTITDDRNPPLSLWSASAGSAAREVVFEASAAGSGPLRVYYGNPDAPAPHYDLEAKVPAELESAPQRLSLQPQRENPVYAPGPRPFSERAPWVVYIVLAAATVVLAWILWGLVRQSAKSSPAPAS